MLVRRQIARLLEPSLQCARFVYEELVKVPLSYFSFAMVSSGSCNLLRVIP